MTKVYKYGLLPPTAGAALIEQQCDLAWRSAVARLRAYEDYRREREAILQREAPACRELAELTEAVAGCQSALRHLRTGAAKPKTDEALFLQAQIQHGRERLKGLRPLAREQRAALRSSGRFEALDAKLKATYLFLAQSFAQAGLFWGQRQLVESAHDQRIKARDRLRIPDQWGAVGIQLQGGLATEAVAGDPRLTITPEAYPIPGRGGKPRPRLRLRIGPENGTAEWPLIQHRPLPAGGSIRFTKVTAERVGRQVRWSVHLTVNESEPDENITHGRAIAVRPTFTDIGGVLVAHESADDTGALAPYALHPSVAGGLERVRGLRAVRDKGRDQVLALLAEWQRQGNPLPSCWPSAIARWESCDRLRQFVLTTWAKARGSGDEPVFAVAAEWAKHDAHLWDWERHAAARALARRLHLYRVEAAHLAETYDVLVVPDTNYAQVAVRRATPERESELSAQGSRQRTLVSPGLLRQCLIQAFLGRGKQVVSVSGGASPAEMLRERSSGRPITLTARAAKFVKRHGDSGATTPEAGRDEDEGWGALAGRPGSDRVDGG